MCTDRYLSCKLDPACRLSQLLVSRTAVWLCTTMHPGPSNYQDLQNLIIWLMSFWCGHHSSDDSYCQTKINTHHNKHDINGHLTSCHSMEACEWLNRTWSFITAAFRTAVLCPQTWREYIDEKPSQTIGVIHLSNPRQGQHFFRTWQENSKFLGVSLHTKNINTSFKMP